MVLNLIVRDKRDRLIIITQLGPTQVGGGRAPHHRPCPHHRKAVKEPIAVHKEIMPFGAIAGCFLTVLRASDAGGMQHVVVAVARHPYSAQEAPGTMGRVTTYSYAEIGGTVTRQRLAHRLYATVGM